MASPYTYTIDADPDALKVEVEADADILAKLVGLRTQEVTVGGDRDIEVHTSPDLTAGEETALDGILAAHTP